MTLKSTLDNEKNEFSIHMIYCEYILSDISPKIISKYFAMK